MNKKALIAITLIAVVLMTIPLVATIQAKRTKGPFTAIAYDFVTVDTETKVCKHVTIIKAHATGKVLAISPALGPFPVVGTLEYWNTKRFDPETGFGTYSATVIWDFTSAGGGRIVNRIKGKVAGMMPYPAWYIAGDGNGVGKGIYKGYRVKTIFSIQMVLPDELLGIPTPFGGQPGVLAVGKIIY